MNITVLRFAKSIEAEWLRKFLSLEVHSCVGIRRFSTRRDFGEGPDPEQVHNSSTRHQWHQPVTTNFECLPVIRVEESISILNFFPPNRGVDFLFFEFLPAKSGGFYFEFLPAK
jgi:hypothetical protein